MGAKAKSGSRNGVEYRTDVRGRRSYRWVINRRADAGGKLRGPWVDSEAQAKSGRVKAQGELAAGTRVKADGATLREDWTAFLAGAEAGTTPSRSGRPFKAATLRGYRRSWAHIDPELGAHKLTAVKRADVQALVDRWAAEGVPPSTITNRLDPLRVIYRRALARDRVAVNPCTGVEVPKSSNGRERIASPQEAVRLLAALPDGEQALWATAIYGGLRRCAVVG